MRVAIAGSAVTISLVLAALLGGTSAVAGMALGLISGGIGILALIGFTKLFAEAAAEGGNPKHGAFLTIIAFAIKVPLFLLAFRLSQMLGGAAPTCFITGVVVVYFGLVVWGMTR